MHLRLYLYIITGNEVSRSLFTTSCINTGVGRLYFEPCWCVYIYVVGEVFWWCGHRLVSFLGPWCSAHDCYHNVIIYLAEFSVQDSAPNTLTISRNHPCHNLVMFLRPKISQTDAKKSYFPFIFVCNKIHGYYKRNNCTVYVT